MRFVVVLIVAAVLPACEGERTKLAGTWNCRVGNLDATYKFDKDGDFTMTATDTQTGAAVDTFQVSGKWSAKAGEVTIEPGGASSGASENSLSPVANAAGLPKPFTLEVQWPSTGGLRLKDDKYTMTCSRGRAPDR